MMFWQFLLTMSEQLGGVAGDNSSKIDKIVTCADSESWLSTTTPRSRADSTG